MNRAGKMLIPLILFSFVVLALAACGPAETPTPCPPTPECPECPPTPTCPPPPTAEEEGPMGAVPFRGQWLASGHADETSESFTHWDEDDPPEVPPSCAKCHSAPGYKDFLGIDGTAARQVDNPAETGTVVNCTTCHNEATQTMTMVAFPSGLEATGLGSEAICYQCHQGRASRQDVNGAIEEAGVDADVVSEELGFVNIHYYAAAATRLGTMVEGGYEYEGKSYDGRFAHVSGFDTCDECHDPHSLQVRIGSCVECHPDAGSVEDLVDARLEGSTKDYDGDGDPNEGIFFELEGLRGTLLTAIQAYAKDEVGTPIIYDKAAYPYYFVDTNGNGEADEDEVNYGNRYTTWTPRLLKAAYNYQTSLKDPGGYTHGGKYHIQLLYDSIADLNPSAVEGLTRNDAGHFDGSSETFRHWDEDGEVPGACSKCHSAEGLPAFLAEGVSVSEPIANGFQCRTCHDTVPSYTLSAVTEVTFPSGAALAFSEDSSSNICLECHQGRQSTFSVRDAVGEAAPDIVVENLGFVNVHYFAAGATVFGTEAKGAYEYEGQSYAGQLVHPDGFDECSECHDAHSLEISAQECGVCHPAASRDDLEAIRIAEPDYDGDGDTDEGIAGEISTIREALYAAIQTYAGEVVETPLVYDGHSYPYYFVDTNENGETDADEVSFGNRYTSWTPRLLEAGYNYHYVAKDPGAYTHNPVYVIQILHDSVMDLGEWAAINVADLVRPTGQ